MLDLKRWLLAGPQNRHRSQLIITPTCAAAPTHTIGGARHAQEFEEKNLPSQDT